MRVCHQSVRATPIRGDSWALAKSDSEEIGDVSKQPNRETPYFRTTPEGSLLLCPSHRRYQSGHTLTGNIQSHPFLSRVLEEELEIWVYLPPGYAAADPWRYPCLYLHDGQNVFDAKTSAFGVEWGVDEAAECLILERKMEPIMIVAVANTPERIAHYTPFPDPAQGGGQGHLYRSFIIDELKPWIDQVYPTRTGALSTAVAGSSLGGLSALYMSWTRPDVFGLVAALSPSLWWGERKLITRIGGDEPSSKPHRIWIDMGTDESRADENDNQVPDMIDDLRTLRAVLLAQGYHLGEDLFYREVAGGVHDEAAWGARVSDVLSTLFPPRASSDRPRF